MINEEFRNSFQEEQKNSCETASRYKAPGNRNPCGKNILMGEDFASIYLLRFSIECDLQL